MDLWNDHIQTIRAIIPAKQVQRFESVWRLRDFLETRRYSRGSIGDLRPEEWFLPLAAKLPMMNCQIADNLLSAGSWVKRAVRWGPADMRERRMIRAIKRLPVLGTCGPRPLNATFASREACSRSRLG